MNLRDARPPIRPAQLRRLHGLWRRWTQGIELSRQAARELRHYYVWLFSQGRAAETRELSELDAASVIDWLEHLVHARFAVFHEVAGTAGRRGFSEQRGVTPTPEAWRALWACAKSLGMNRAALDAFIARHYTRRRLRSVRDIQTMADLNRVLWGLKAMLRRAIKRPPSHTAPRAA
ncbi:MAG TPA: hypothetical protein VGA40_06025 [Candidatus Acidoferrales bacterium]